MGILSQRPIKVKKIINRKAQILQSYIGGRRRPKSLTDETVSGVIQYC